MLKYNIPIEQDLNMGLLNAIDVKLMNIANAVSNYTGRAQFPRWFYFLSNTDSCKLIDKLEPIFLDLDELVNLQILIEASIVGTVASIRHPLLQKAWMMTSDYQYRFIGLIPRKILTENIYLMYLSEQPSNLLSKRYLMKKISTFLANLDETNPDSYNISIHQLNSIPFTGENSTSIKSLLNINDIGYE